MGAACTTGMAGLSRGSNITPVKVLIMGKQDAGKTFLLYSWKYGVDSIVSIEPTSHFNVDTVSSSSGQKFLVYDLGGNIGSRQRNFFEGADGVIYMLGPNEDDFMQEEEKGIVLQLLQEQDLENIPFLFVIRKQTQHNNSSQVLPEEIQHSLDGREWDLVDMRPHCQEDSDLVLRVLEKLLKKAHIKPE